ncbi:hypothetical protein FACS1894176_06940 [Bacteroidia bacterium]|nr:hypothetical protein FACS1894176_06940 [Bacteroidia bacterium]
MKKISFLTLFAIAIINAYAQPFILKGQLEINVRNLSAGIYFVKVFYKGRWFAEKIIVK